MSSDTQATRSERPSDDVQPDDRVPSIEPATIDRLNLEAALRDFETANARVVDLTSRLTLLHEDLLRTRHELAMSRISLADIDELRNRITWVEQERDAARAETEMYRSSRSYRIGFKITRLLRKVMP